MNEEEMKSIFLENMARLDELKELKNNGKITEEEFKKKSEPYELKIFNATKEFSKQFNEIGFREWAKIKLEGID